ncbi:MAG: hypothetical protein MJY62_00285 [Bacteroidales bacterium]|nr:hypothetical protein [Bacteroidales bacterium]
MKTLMILFTVMELTVLKVDRILSTPISGIPALLDREEVPFNPINIDNWNWTDSNPEVKFRIAHCGDAIALHFHVKDSEQRAVASCDDGRVWEDSCCEFFVSPEGNDFYYNFECNCIGKLLLHGGRKGEERPSAPAEVYASVQRWSTLGTECFDTRQGECEWDLVEIIPASALFLHDIKDLSGLDMKANFYKCGDNLTRSHYLSWAPIQNPKPAFHCPEFFGRIHFNISSAR